MASIMWFRNDLRIEDNEAFFDSLKSGSLILVYILDNKYLKNETTSSFHVQFLKNCIEALELDLKNKYDAHLNIYYGDTLDIFSALINKYDISDVYSHRIFKESYMRVLDNNCQSLFDYNNIKWRKFDQFGIQLQNRNRDTWSSDWKKLMSNRIINNHSNTCKFINDYRFNMNEIEKNKIYTNTIQKGASLVNPTKGTDRNQF